MKRNIFTLSENFCWAEDFISHFIDQLSGHFSSSFTSAEVEVNLPGKRVCQSHQQTEVKFHDE